jgi:hypothetical protein
MGREASNRLLPLPLREGVGGRGAYSRVCSAVRTPPPNPLPQGEGEVLYRGLCP